METKTYQVGQEVAYNVSRHYANIKFDVVGRVTKTTIVLESGRRFNHRGEELKSQINQNPFSRLWDLGNARAHAKRMELQNKAVRAVRDLEKVLAGKRTGGGDYILHADQVEAIKALTKSLATKEC